MLLSQYYFFLIVEDEIDLGTILDDLVKDQAPAQKNQPLSPLLYFGLPGTNHNTIAIGVKIPITKSV